MKRSVLVLALSLTPLTFAQELSIATASEAVAPVASFGGRAPTASAAVYVIVNPADTPQQFWVQARAVVDARKNWLGSAHLGDPGPAHRGLKFAVWAIADPQLPVKAGDVLAQLPPARWTSKPIIVTRK